MIPVIEVESLLISSTGQIITTTSTGAKLGLDVNVLGGNMVGIGVGYQLRYDKMINDQNLIKDSYVTVYSTSVPGKIHSLAIKLKNNDVDVRLTVDSVSVMNGINCYDIYANFGLDSGDVGGLFSTKGPSQVPRFIYTYEQGKGFILEFPGALIFNTSFVVELKSYVSSNKLNRGIIVRSIS